MTTERNAQGVDGLAEVMGLLRRPEDKSLVGADLADARNLAAVAAVNYLRSYGEAIRELVTAIKQYRTDYVTEYCHFPDCNLCKRRDAAAARLNAALAKFTTESRKE